MNTNPITRLAPLAGIGLAALLPLGAQAQTVYIDETFETDTLSAAPADTAQRRALATTVVAGTGVIGTDQAARLNDSSASTGREARNPA